MKNFIVLMLMALMILPLVSASGESYLPHEYSTPFTLTASSNNASTCNLTYIQYADNTKTNFNIELDKVGQDFSKTISAGNYTILGAVCHGITCSDSSSNLETGSICREITPSGDKGVLGLSIILILVVYGIAFFGFFGRNIWVAVIGGMAMMALGIYTTTNGIDIYRNFMTQAFSAVTIAIGAIFALTAGLELIDELK